MHLCRKSGWDIDLVCPVPDGSRPAAIQIAADLNLPYREGLVKNRYVGRTFIMPDQRLREMSVRRKLNAMSVVFQVGMYWVQDTIPCICVESVVTDGIEAGIPLLFFLPLG